MTISINVTFNHGRCFFNGFNEKNDTNPETGKAGINYYRFFLIGCILEKMGFAKGIHCFQKGESKIVYINTKSFLKWREKHASDEYITLSDTAEDSYSLAKRKEVLDFENDFQGSIEFIIKKYETLSYDAVIEKAQKEISESDDKQERISEIKDILDKSKYKESYGKKERPNIHLYTDQDPTFLVNLPGIKFGQDKKESIFSCQINNGSNKQDS
jgi:hypothetical protein